MPSSLPSITIVTPCLNAAATIRHTIESVAAQSYAGEIEHIVIDGGSTDGTIEIVRSAGLRYVSEPDRGLSHASRLHITSFSRSSTPTISIFPTRCVRLAASLHATPRPNGSPADVASLTPVAVRFGAPSPPIKAS
jgi:cellulose synthase/poly-beta-1,6-N-acetylglucosamine synthase-like glycosyltransferase